MKIVLYCVRRNPSVRVENCNLAVIKKVLGTSVEIKHIALT